MNETFINALSELINRDRGILINILRNRGVLNRNNLLNKDLIRKRARESLKTDYTAIQRERHTGKTIFYRYTRKP
jgi:hypothetical protein